MERIYLDHSATTPLHASARLAMQQWLAGPAFGNASSVHTQGRDQEALLSAARAAVGQLLGARPSEIIFTASGTEAANLAIKGAAHWLRQQGRPAQIVVTTLEHECVLEACRHLETEGFQVLRLPVKADGSVDEGLLEALITPQTGLVSVMLANHELGCLLPVRRIARRAHSVGALVHTDAAMAVGRIPVDVSSLEVDMLSFSGHKAYGPTGTGGLYLKRGQKLVGLVHGGPQERKRRAGAENLLGLVGLGAAAAARHQELSAPDDRQTLDALVQSLWQGIQAEIADVRLNSPLSEPYKTIPGVLNVSFDGVEGESLLMNLDLQGFSVSSGSPCSSGSLEPSPVLLALGLSEAQARSAVRFSLGPSSRGEDIAALLQVLPGSVSRLRRLTSRR